jgi:23S rRNA (uracil1939-C5)-methyltransferase
VTASPRRFGKTASNRDKNAAKRGPVLTELLRIVEVAAGGLGIAKSEQHGVVMVPRVIEGELVAAQLDGASRPLRARLLRVEEPSPERVAARCALVERCGGCDFMHMSASEQSRAHTRIVTRALRHALRNEPPAPTSHGAAEAFGYRERARLVYAADGPNVRVGYRRAGSRELVAIAACGVLAPALEALLPQLPEWLAGAKGDGELGLALGHEGRPVLTVRARGELAASTFGRLDAAVRAGVLAGARVETEGATIPATFGDPRPHMRGADGAPLLFAEAAFTQPSEAGATALALRVAALAAEGDEPRHVVELFAGSGTLSILLARHAASFVAVEAAEDAARAARENLGARGLTGRVVVGDAETFALPSRTDLVVLDPPRTGARGAAQRIAESRVREVLYVSCDPPTLARDLALLAAAGFVVDTIETFELFPQTSHVETLVRVRRARRGAAPP